MQLPPAPAESAEKSRVVGAAASGDDGEDGGEKDYVSTFPFLECAAKTVVFASETVTSIVRCLRRGGVPFPSTPAEGWRGSLNPILPLPMLVSIECLCIFVQHSNILENTDQILPRQHNCNYSTAELLFS